MTPFVSVYLDGMRVVAALSVLVFHWGLRDGPEWATFAYHGHDAVIVFFVVSGFVIAYATERSRTPAEYVFARLTRVYSVALPAMVLAVAAFPLIGPDRVNPTLSASDVLLNLTFLNWSWGQAAVVPHIGQWWSLTYEVWYYALFGVLAFSHGWWRWGLFGVIALAAGPRVMLLAPCWWAGVLAYRHWRQLPCPALLAILAPALYILAKIGGVREIISVAPLLGSLWGSTAQDNILGLSRWFPWDYTLAALCALHVAAVAKLTRDFRAPIGAVIVKWCAGATFSLYLTHAVFLGLFMAVAGEQSPLALAVAVMGALVFAAAFERPLRFWRSLLRRRRRRGDGDGYVRKAGILGTGRDDLERVVGGEIHRLG